VEIKEANAKTVADFIEYVYTDKANYTVELLILADRFQVSNVLKLFFLVTARLGDVLILLTNF